MQQPQQAVTTRRQRFPVAEVRVQDQPGRQTVQDVEGFHTVQQFL